MGPAPRDWTRQPPPARLPTRAAAAPSFPLSSPTARPQVESARCPPPPDEVLARLKRSCVGSWSHSVRARRSRPCSTLPATWRTAPSWFSSSPIGTGSRDCAERERAGVPTFVARLDDFYRIGAADAALTRTVSAYRPDPVVSAGFMKILGSRFLAAHAVVNSHPALLPSFLGGARSSRGPGVRRVRVTGCTIHLVDEGVDTGPVVGRGAGRGSAPTTPSTRFTNASRSSNGCCSSTLWAGWFVPAGPLRTERSRSRER